MGEVDRVVVAASQAHWHPHWRHFGIVAVICGVFVALTTVAMLLYPGGTFPIVKTHGYLFFINYFSDLGQTRTQSGAANYPSMALFILAVLGIGIALATFFRAFSTYFKTHTTSPSALRLNRIATFFGIASAVCFIGVAAIPENLYAAGHYTFVQGAFNSLLVATVLTIAALFKAPSVSRWLLVVNIAFVVVLFGYVLLLIFGPTPKTLLGDEITAVCQKIIVYLAVATVFAQALIVRTRLPRPSRAMVGARVS